MGNSAYDEVFQVKEDKNLTKVVAPAFADIPNAVKDCHDMKGLLEKYDFEFGPV